MNSKKICPIVLTVTMVFFFLAVMPVSAEVIELWNRKEMSYGTEAMMVDPGIGVME